jgi:hypothetical protein
MVGNYPIFIAHTTQDENLARFICRSLDNIVEFHPYLAQDYFDPGENFKERIQTAIHQSRFFIVILSQTALTNQWVNQELGFACSVKKAKPRNYNIVPLSQSHLQLKGFITKDTEDIIMYDRENDNSLMGKIIFTLRSKLYNGLSHRNLRFNVRCEYCLNKTNLPTINTIYLPDHNTLNEAIGAGHDSWFANCPNCGNQNYSNIYTWNQIPSK